MGMASIFKSRKTDSLSSVLFFKDLGIDTFNTSNIYSDKMVSLIGNYRLDTIILVRGFGILKEPILSSTKYGVLSYHHGDIQKYRGMPPGFWELYNGEKEMGVTVQILSEKLDGGKPIVQRQVLIDKSDSLASLLKKAYSSSVNMMLKAVNKLENNEYEIDSANHLGKVYTLPNFRQWFILKVKLMHRKIF